MLPHLDVPTLQLATGLVIGIAGILLIVSSGPRQATRAFATWGAAMLLGSIGLSLMALVGPFDGITELAGTAFLLAGTGLAWSATRLLAGRATIPGLVILGPALLVASALGRSSAEMVPTMIAVGTGGLYTLASAIELWRARTRRGLAGDVLIALLGVHGGLYLARAIGLGLSPMLPALGDPDFATLLTLEGLGHSVTIALLLLALTKEQVLRERILQAEQLALLDGLTGLGNRRMFDETLESEVKRALRDLRPLTLLMVDADLFKRINDAYGHQAGDDCLRSIARAIASCVRRPSDVVTRFGGEEFAILLPGTEEVGGEAVASMIHASVAEAGLPHPGPSGRVTVSIGVATMSPLHGVVRGASLLRAADSALYAAKALGRNRTEMAGGVPPEVAVRG